MLKSISYRDFKSFQDAELTLDQVSFLIGSNASGKSNAIEGLRILSELATGRELSVVLDGSGNKDSNIRGGSHGCLRHGMNSFGLGCRVELDGEEYQYEIRIHVGEHIYVERESLRQIWSNGNTDDIFYTKDPPKDSADIKVAYANGKKGRNPDVECIRIMAVLSQLPGKLYSGKSVKHDIKILQGVLHNLRQILFLDPVPSLMRDYARIKDDRLRPTANNLSAVLCSLCDGNEPAQIENNKLILDAVRSLPENEIQNIAFVKTMLGDVIFTLQEAYSDEPMDAKRLSDGTLRCMAVVAALVSEPEGSLLVIEEVDNGLHPGRIKGILQALARISSKRRMKVLVTTHNPALLNAIQGDLLGGVSLCYRKKEDASSNFVRLVDMSDYFRLAAGRGIGDLLTDDALARSLRQSRSRIDLQWLEGGEMGNA